MIYLRFGVVRGGRAPLVWLGRLAREWCDFHKFLRLRRLRVSRGAGLKRHPSWRTPLDGIDVSGRRPLIKGYF